MFKLDYNQDTGFVDLVLECGIPTKIRATVSLATNVDQLRVYPAMSNDTEDGMWRIFGRHSGETPRLDISSLVGVPVVLPQIAYIKTEILQDSMSASLAVQLLPSIIANVLQVYLINPADLVINDPSQGVAQLICDHDQYPAEWPVIPNIFQAREMIDVYVLGQLGFTPLEITGGAKALPITATGPQIKTYEYRKGGEIIRFCLDASGPLPNFAFLKGVFDRYVRLPDGVNESVLQMTGKRRKYELPVFGRVEGELTKCGKLLVDTVF